MHGSEGVAMLDFSTAEDRTRTGDSSQRIARTPAELSVHS
jgi:hypothetical protein